MLKENKKQKVGFVTIVGKPNAGKSTLINAFVGAKVAIASPRKNTTRNQIRGIYNDEDSQIILIDTPGFLKRTSKLDDKMHEVIINSLQGVDIILFLLPFWKELDKEYLEKIKFLKSKGVKKYLILTKIDKASNQMEMMETISKHNEEKLFDKIIPISALKGANLQMLLDELKKDLPEDDIKYYDEDVVSESSDQFYVSEIVREKALFNLSEEVPHQIFVRVEKASERRGKIYFRAEIIVSRESLKGIVIGKGGEMIKKIGQQARFDLEKYFEESIYLELFVKVQKDWQNKTSIIKEIEHEV